MTLGHLAGLHLTAKPSSIAASILLGVVFVGIALLWLDFAPVTAMIGGLLAVVAHWASVLGHHLGHAWAAQRTGFPMAGVRLAWLLGGSIYPATEPDLPAAVHIRRALGGPAASFLLALLAGLSLFLIRPSGTLGWWLALFFGLNNFLVFTLGAFLPLGFTDGSTILYWWNKR